MSTEQEQRNRQVGIDRIIRLKWLEQIAYLSMSVSNELDIKSFLKERLQNEFHTHTENRRNSLDKTITILMKIWVRPPKNLCHLQREGLKLLSHIPREHHIAIHWGMTLATYPFWGAVASQVGRLFSLQGRATHAQVRRRIIEQYGQRPTVKDAVRRVLRSMADWGVILDVPPDEAKRLSGTYVPGLMLHINNLKLIAWLVEAFLYTHPNGSVPLRALLGSPSFFPFRLRQVTGSQLVSASECLDVLHHSLDQELVILKRK